jgi:PAS domain S-box-containing protein
MPFSPGKVTMQLDPHTVVTTMVVMALVFTGLATLVLWTGRPFPGYRRWLWAGPLTVLTFFLLNLRPKAPDWLSIVAANTVLVVASIFHLEGAYEFRGLPVRRRFVYTGGVVAIGGVAFFLYIVPNLNVRAAIMSTFLAVVFMRSTIALLGANPPMHRLGLRLTGTLSGLCAATHIVRVVYCSFGPPITDLFALSGANGATFSLLSAELSLLPIGYILLADERVIWDLKEAKERAGSLQESIHKSEERQAWLLKLSDTLRPLASPAEIQFTAARLLGERLRVNRVLYADIEDDHYIMRQSWTNGVAPFVGRRPVTIFGEILLVSYRAGETVVVSDVCTDPRFTVSERSILLCSEISAFTGLMRLKGGQWVSAFSAESATPRLWPREEIDLIRDVAERTWDAVERACAAEVLREREQRLRLALDASAGGSWTWDISTSRVDWDDRFRKLYGFAAEELPTFDAWFSRVHEENRSSMLSLLDEVLRWKTRDDWDNTFRIVRPDGTISWIESLGHADRNAEGQAMRLTGLELDVTERRRAEEILQARRHEERERALHKEAEEALRRSHAELEQRTLQLRRLASQLTVAEQTARRQLASTLHDGLQQLLFSAGITLDEAMKTNGQDDQVELLQRARADVKEAVESARTLSVSLFPPVLHVGGLPAALSWLAKRSREQYGIVVNVTADPQANPDANDVRILLFEGVRELVFNAVKHAGIDRVDVNLALGPGDTIHIQVSDEGVGFDPGATVHDKNQQQAGLGLFSIQERLALFGGHLDIQSDPGKGSRFTLTLPRTGLPGVAADGTEAQRRDTAWQERLVYGSASDRSKSLRILIADDHPVARGGLRELFGKRPELQVVGEAASGVEAIAQAVALQPDVIVMDVSMPQMNGIDATREIHRSMRHIRIVGLSTHDDESTERLMRKAGAEAYFAKNEGTDRLLDYLLSLVARAKHGSAG